MSILPSPVGRLAKRILPAVLLFCLGAGRPHAGNGGTPSTAASDRLAREESKLKLLTEKLASLQRELDSLDERQTTLLGELHRLELEIRHGRQQIELLQLQLDRGYREIDSHLKRIQALESSIRELRPYLEQRSVSLYKLGRLSYLRLLLSVQEPRELARAYGYVSRLARADMDKIHRFKNDQASLERTKAELLVRTKRMLETRRAVENTTRALERRRDTKAALLQEIHNRREMAETFMFELEQARQDLTKLVQSLSEGEPTETGPVLLPIRIFRGELGWPTVGRVASRFGKQLHPRFRTVTVQNGIEIEAPLGTPVLAVYDGRVVFSSWFRGYGKLLIISHPGNVYSLYGHLSEVKVREGQLVGRDEDVASVGDTGALSGPSLYFEVREKGKPVDPEIWLGEPQHKPSPSP